MNCHATLLVGHADPNSFNFRLAEHYASGFEAAGGSYERFNLAELDFDPVLRKGFRQEQPLEPDLLAVRSAVERSHHLVWVFPTYWASPPAVVRGLFDRLFLPNWAFRYEKGRAFPLGLLAGRSARVILTMDSPTWWYRIGYGRAVHKSFGFGSLSFCGLRPVRFSTISNMLHLGEQARSKWLGQMKKEAQKDFALRRASTLRGQNELRSSEGSPRLPARERDLR